MINRKYDVLRNWVLGAAATGLLLPTMPVLGQTKSATTSTKKTQLGKANGTVKTPPVQILEPPQLLSVPDMTGSSKNTVLPVSQMEVAAGEKSEVQKQLEALYEQDGREMPAMNMNLQPISPQNGQPQQSATTAPVTGSRTNSTTPMTTQTPGRTGQGYTQYQPRSGATPYQAQPNTQAPRNYGAAIDAQSQPAPAPKQSRVAGFFKKLTGSNKPPINQAPIPPDYANIPANAPANSPAVPGVPPASAANVNAQSTANATTNPATMKYYAPPKSTPSTTQLANKPMFASTTVNSTAKQPTANVQTVVSINNLPDVPMPTPAIPVLATQPLPIQVTTVQTSLPPLMTGPQTPVVASKSTPAASAPVASEKIRPSEAAIVADFPNPFPEVPESAVDSKLVKLPRSATAVIEEPKVTSAPALTAPVDPDSEVANQAVEDPFAVTAKDFSEPSINEKIESKPALTSPNSLAPPAASASPEVAGSPNETATLIPDPLMEDRAIGGLDAPPGLTAPSLDEPKPAAEQAPDVGPNAGDIDKDGTPVNSTESQMEKIRRIRERFGMKGLKGFCPVTLHDDRDLVDAKPEFHFTHRSQKFHFASAEARDKFEADPVRYAPAAYGADVVALSRDKDVVEGTLDYAAWFKGRLYLFGSQANYDAFIAAPAKFATLAGVE